MEARRRRAASAAATTRRKRLYTLLALVGDYLKYLFMKRGRLLGRVARRSLALVLSSGGGRRHSGKQYLAPASSSAAPWPPCALAEHEFSCSNSPSPAFLAARRLRSRLKRGASPSGCFGALRAPCGCGGSSPAPEAAGQDAAEGEEEEEEVDGGWACGGMELDVDYRAEEFITMFYEQLRAQSFQPAVFQCSSP